MTTKEKIEFLVNHGVKITALAEKVGCNKTTLGRWLRGESNISIRLDKDLNLMIQEFIKDIELLKE